MIITLTGADFSESNIGVLTTWSISKALGTGASYSGPTTVDRGGALSATVTIAGGYELGVEGVTVTMGGNVLGDAFTVDDNVVTISIAEVTGNVVISVPTVSTSENYTITYLYLSGGVQIKASTTEVVASGTTKAFSADDAPSIEGYTVSSVSPESATINSDLTVTFTYIAVGVGIESNLLASGTLHEGYTMSASSSKLSVNEEVYVYADVPVEAGATYYGLNFKRCWWQDADKNDISTYNGKTNSPQWTATAPAGAAYWRGCAYYTEQDLATASFGKVVE